MSFLLKSSFIILLVLNLTGCFQSVGERAVPLNTPQSPPASTSAANNGGGGTDVGSGGSGVEAEWRNIAQELVEKLRVLKAAPVEYEVWTRIKKEFPTLVAEAVVEFKNYPLIYGEETADKDNPGGRHWDTSHDCSRVDLEDTDGVEKDAINFASKKLIKVSQMRFRCYPKDKTEVRRLVFHEYLGLMGLTENEDGKTHYELTNKILKSLAIVPKFENGLPTTLIGNCKELQNAFSRDLGSTILLPARNWRLSQDIDCSESKQWNNGAGFLPRVLADHFDGNGYVIKNLWITSKIPAEKSLNMRSKEWREKAGLVLPAEGHSLFYMNCSQCQIANLEIVQGQSEGGALLIAQNRGIISNVSIQGIVEGRARTLGGLVDQNEGTISFSAVDIFLKQKAFPEQELFNQFAGGLAGSSSGIIHHSTVRGTIIGREFVGGLIGQSSGHAESISGSVRIQATDYWSVGGLIASNTGTLRNSSVTGSIVLNGTSRPHVFPAALNDPAYGDMSEMTLGAYVGGLVGNGFGYKEEREALGQENAIYNPYGAVIESSESNVSICGGVSSPQGSDIRVGVHINQDIGYASRGVVVRNNKASGTISSQCARAPL